MARDHTRGAYSWFWKDRLATGDVRRGGETGTVCGWSNLTTVKAEARGSTWRVDITDRYVDRVGPWVAGPDIVMRVMSARHVGLSCRPVIAIRHVGPHDGRHAGYVGSCRPVMSVVVFFTVNAVGRQRCRQRISMTDRMLVYRYPVFFFVTVIFDIMLAAK